MAPALPTPVPRHRSRWTPELVVDTGGLACVLGYLALACYSRGSLGVPSLGPFFALIGWVALPWLAVFALLGKHPDDVPVGRLIVWAVALRACGLFGVPLFEDDYFRYLWDGYRFAETGTPYGWTPAASFADENVPAAFQRVLDQVNHPDVPTIYGPTTQFVFLLGYLVAPASLWPVQLILLTIDILLIRLLTILAAPRFVLLYAWCPLVIKEIAFTAHPDGLGAFLLVAAVLLRRREHMRAAAVCLALAVGAKVFALLLVPFVLARAGPRAWAAFACALALMYLPFAIQGGTDLTALALFAATWEFNSALFGLLSQWLPAAETKWLLGTVLVAMGAAYWLRFSRRDAGQIPRGDWIFGCFLVAAPVINPWYAIWLLPFAAVFPSCWAWTASLALLLSYVTGSNLGVFDLEPFAHPHGLRPLEFGLIFAAVGVDVWRRRSTA
ncbi:MAG: hypothetical protein OXH68_02830 [Gammaproteobacteria bacterium]|nr:hypothetical protein [Gammaproteobacteria bacterium]